MSPRSTSSSVITLTTDFGSRDGYVAAMKGVMLGIRPDATLVDISHELPPQDIPHAAFVLGTACRYFPPSTIHVAVVDPGVGTARRPLVLITPGGTYVAPDNGLLTYVLMEYGAGATTDTSGTSVEDSFMRSFRVPLPKGCFAYVLNRDEFWLKPLSDTFHGRDIFAPVAAHLSAGVSPEELGKSVDDVDCLYVPMPVEQGEVVQGRIIYIDRFGNLVSNIRPRDPVGSDVYVEVEGTRIRGLSSSYASAEGLLAIVGSHGYLEIAVREGSAAERLRAKVGAQVKVMPAD